MTEPGVGGTVLRRFVGRRLRQLREDAEVTQVEAAEAVDLSRFTIIAMEAGKPGVKLRASDLRVLLDLYRASTDDRKTVLARAAEIRSGSKHWLSSQMGTLPLLVQLEGDADTVRQYEAEVVPGLLQTRSYAEAMYQAPVRLIDDATVRKRVEVRMSRQAVLNRPIPRLDVILNEAVLRRAVGGPQVMAEQLDRLVDDSHRSNVSVRVLPFAVGAHGGMSTPFSIFDFPADQRGPLEPPMVYVDSALGAMHFQQPDQHAIYQAIWEGLSRLALDGDGSRELITTIRKEVYTDG